MKLPALFALLSLSLFATSAHAATASYEPTELEQFMLQMINRARANGNTEMVRLGNSGNVNEGPPKLGSDSWTILNIVPPLAWNTQLATAAQAHAGNLDSVDWFFNSSTYGGSPHNPTAPFPGAPSSSNSRIAATGYSNTFYGCRVSSPNNRLPGPENIAMGYASPSDGWSNAEKLTAFNASHEGLYEDFSVTGRGHRNTMAYEWYKEIGIGSVMTTDYNSSTKKTVDSYYIVQNFGHSSTSSDAFFTGMAYNDTDSNSFFTPNSTESIPNLTVQALQSGVVMGSTAAFATGGYSLRMAAGTYEIRFVKTDGKYHSAGNVVLGSDNVEVNVKNPVFITPVLTYASWIATYPGASAMAGFTQDADFDGINNGLEHLLGTSPVAFSQGLTQISKSGTSLKFRHTQTNSLATDVTISYQWSTDMLTWYASGATNPSGVKATISTSIITNNVAPANDVIEVTVAITTGTPKKIFSRLVATKT